MSQELHSSENEKDIRNSMLNMLKSCPIPSEEFLQNIGLFVNSKTLSRILCMDHLYRLQVDVHGSIIEFGTRWGQNLSLFAALRGIYEPFNRSKEIIGFDTFSGFPSVGGFDNTEADIIRIGGLSCTPDYATYLKGVMSLQEADNPLSHIEKFKIIAGDACVEFEKFLVDYPETIVSLVYFDFDIYEPTKKCLSLLQPHLVRGSVVAFDELNDHLSPGETVALKEIIGLNNVRLRRFPYASRVSYYVVE